MAVTQVYTAVPNDVITAARWNNEFGNIYNNGTDIAFPLTKAVSCAGFTITLDASGVTTLTSTAAVGIVVAVGAKTGTPGVGANQGQALQIPTFTFTDSDTAGSGTAAEFSSVSIGTPTLAATNTLVTTTDASTLYIQNAPAAGTNETITNSWTIWADGGAVRLDGDLRVDGNLRSNAALGYHIQGLTYSRDAGDLSNDILVAIGQTTSADAAQADRRVMTLTSSLIKRLDAVWVVGTNQGMLDSGTVADTDYYLHLIMRADTGVVDVLASLSATGPTMPANYTYRRLFGWLKRTAGVNVAFTTYELEGGGLEFAWTTPTLDISLSATLTTARRTDALPVPLNFSVIASLRTSSDDSSNSSIYIITCPDETDTAPANATAPLGTQKNQVANITAIDDVVVRTSTTGTIASRANVATYDELQIVTKSFSWARRN